ncbi:MAG: EF2563 family selenium-dependent molybdenum hydroxylase system protein [Deltaproteobacteria bacterium]|nr:EF2563 family selenium-dependent molybdenum hydroxylase system protein [Deltaproteobacteria bacterium]
MTTLALLRGGGELGTGVAHALFGAGLRIVVVELPLPRTLRHGVAFATAAIDDRIEVAGVTAVHCRTPSAIEAAWAAAQVAVWTEAEAALALEPAVLVDARMRRLSEPLSKRDEAPVVIGIGPGFVAGDDVDFVIESNRGPRLGTVISQGSAEGHTGIPGDVLGLRGERLLRAPRAGILTRVKAPGDFVDEGEEIAQVDGAPVRSQLRGMIRGLKLTGVPVGERHKVGDVDPRRDRTLLKTMTDKARAVGQATVKALEQAGILPASAPGPEATQGRT